MNHARRGQAMTEYVIVVLLIIAAVVAMQTFVKRRHQELTRAMVTDGIGRQFNIDGHTVNVGNQYEPYYVEQNVTRATTSNTHTNIGLGFTTNKTENETVITTGTMNTGVNQNAANAWR